MPAIPFSRRRWLGASAMGCGCMLASSVGLAESAEASRIPLATPLPEDVTDLSKGLRGAFRLSETLSSTSSGRAFSITTQIVPP
jgi:hypothetical protein